MNLSLRQFELLLADERAKFLAVGELGVHQSDLAIMPGSFNPLHRAHQEMLQLAVEKSGRNVAFEIAVTNVDKSPLDFKDVEFRLSQFASNDAVWVSNAPTFEQKAELFPNSTFVVGADTMLRIINPKYYRGSKDAMLKSLESIRSRGCQFLAFGRAVSENYVRQPERLDDDFLVDFQLPKIIGEVTTWVTQSEFRIDLSSTELREKRDAQND